MYLDLYEIGGTPIGWYNENRMFFVKRLDQTEQESYSIPKEVYNDLKLNFFYLYSTTGDTPTVLVATRKTLEQDAKIMDTDIALDKNTWLQADDENKSLIVEHYKPRQVTTTCDVQTIITNMPEEMFNDALFYQEQANSAQGIFEKWRFLRSSIVNFCASAEAWVQNFIVAKLRAKQSPNQREQDWLDFLTIPGSSYPGSTTVKSRFFSILSMALDINLRNNQDYQAVVDKYIEIANLRNHLLHFSAAYHSEVYNDGKVEYYSSNAPQIVGELIKKICSIAGTTPPVWLDYTQSRKFD